MIVGIGDFRQEKGKGNNGLYELVDQNDERFVELVENGDMTAQDEALANPVCSDAETEDLLSWYQEELVRRDKHAPSDQDNEEEEGIAEAAE